MSKKLYETITAENWTHFSPHLEDVHRGAGCLHAHLIWAQGNGEVKARRRRLVEETIAVLYPDRATTISAFNDHPDTTVEDVIRVCKVADV